MEDEDKLTLSSIFKSLPQRTPPIGGYKAHSRQRTSHARKRLRSKSYHAINENEEYDGGKASLCRSFNKGDFIWAKAFPYTWWPGKIEGFKGPLVSVSFFGCSRTCSFYPSDIRGFEESFPQMVRVFGRKLSDEIGLALNGFARGTAMGLKCSCEVYSMDQNRSLAVKNGFNPVEIFSFAINKAVSPHVASEEIATVVRVSTNLIAFRSALTICGISEVDGRFCAEGLLDFVVDMAISPYSDYKRIDGFGKAVAQLNAFRRFASVKPDGVYQLSWEFMDNNSLESYNVEAFMGQPYCTLEDEICQKMSTFPDVDISVESQEVFELLDDNSRHEDKELCQSNMMDIHFFDMDEKCYQEQLADILHSYAEDEPVKPEVGFEVLPKSTFSCTSNAAQYFSEVPQIAAFGETALPILADDPEQGTALLYSFREEDALVNPDADAKILDNNRGLSAGMLQSCMEETSVKPEVVAKVQHICEFSCNSNCVQCSDEIPQVALEKTGLQILANDRGLLAHLPHTCTEGASVEPEVGARVQHMFASSCSSGVAQCSYEISQTARLEKTALQILAIGRGQSAGMLHSCKEDALVKPELGAKVQHISPFSCSSNAAHYSNDVPLTAPLEKTALQFLDNDQGNLGSILHSCTVDAPVKPVVDAKVSQVQQVSSFSCTSDAAECSNEIPQIAPTEETEILGIIKLSESTTRTHKLSQSSSTPSKTVLSSEFFTGEDKHDEVNNCNDRIFSPIFSCKLGNYGHHSKHFTSSSQHDRYCGSRWQGFYAAPLIKDGLQLTNTLKNSGSKWKAFYAAPLIKDGPKLTNMSKSSESKWQASYSAPSIKDGLQLTNTSKSLDGINCSTPRKKLEMTFLNDRNNCTPKSNLAVKFSKDRSNCSSPKKLTMKFPRDYSLPSKEVLEKKFRVFGPLDHRRTNVFFYTGVGEVVFLHQADATKAYNYVMKKAIFGQASMRFWLSSTESTKNSNVPGVVHPSFNVKTCLKRHRMPQIIDNRKHYRVRFSTEH